MKTFSLVLMNLTAIGLVSCSSAPVPKSPVDTQNENIINHMSKGKKIIGKDFESKFQEDGFINGEFVAIGSVKAHYTTNEKAMISMASMEAKSTLLESAPSEYKKIIQNALSYVNNNNGTQDSVGIYITEVKALTGIRVNFSDTQCVLYAEPKVDVNYEYIRECRAIARVPATNLDIAYKYTMDRKYKIEEQIKLKEIMSKQLMGVMLKDGE